jgi:hypothetical protein
MLPPEHRYGTSDPESLVDQGKVVSVNHFHQLIGKAMIPFAISDTGADNRRFQTMQNAFSYDLLSFDLV